MILLERSPIKELLYVIIPCCLQAFLLERSTTPSTLIFIQAIIPAFNKDCRKISLRMQLLQGIFYAFSLLLPWVSGGSFALAGVFRAASPVLTLILRKDFSKKNWIAAFIVSFGLILPIALSDLQRSDLMTFFLMGSGALSSAALSVVQEKAGPSYQTMAIIGSLILFPTIQMPDNFTEMLLYTFVSLWCTRSVAFYAKSCQQNAFKLSMTLSLRRIISILLSTNFSIKLLLSGICVVSGVFISQV
jgi:hypothetical protein